MPAGDAPTTVPSPGFKLDRLRQQELQIIGFPMDLGGARRGVDMGPSALRIAELDGRLRALGYTVHDSGDIPIAGAQDVEVHNPKLRYLEPIAAASVEMAKLARQALDAGNFPIMIGGDHSMSIGTLAGISAHCKDKGRSLGVLWVDAHADINTDRTTISGNIHGMPVAVCLGHGCRELTEIAGFSPKLSPADLIYIGLRDLDPGERELVRRLGIESFTMNEVDHLGLSAIMHGPVAELARRVDHLHLSFDLDGLDPQVAPGVGTPVPGGLTYREGHLVMETVAAFESFSSLDMAEVNPVLDQVNRTAELAVGLVLSAMGKRIL